MPVVNEALERELAHVADPREHAHIRSQWDEAEPILQEISYRLIVGDQNEIDRLTRQALDEGYSANTILDHGLVAGMAIVGVKFRDNLIFVPEVLVAARAMKAGMAHIEPILSDAGVEPAGVVVMGTVKGDLHDIGKNLCIMMLRGAGFTVHDLGVDIQPDEFIDAVMEHEAQIIGMSALLTTTMPNMGRTVEAIEEAGLRDEIRVMVGGAPLNQEFADDFGADGYGKDAISCVELAKRLIGAGDAEGEESAPVTGSG
jgi:5-methyltetrahydrofolate--homocysteine methyltransferase